MVKRLSSLCGATTRHHPAHTAPHLDIRLLAGGPWDTDAMEGVECACPPGGLWRPLLSAGLSTPERDDDATLLSALRARRHGRARALTS